MNSEVMNGIKQLVEKLRKDQVSRLVHGIIHLKLEFQQIVI